MPLHASFEGFHGSVFEVSNLLRCGTTFWDNLVIPSCRNFQSLEDETTWLSQNVMHALMQHHIL